MAKDYYAILGVPRNSTADVIRMRFLQLARERHPDRFQGEEKSKAELEFQEITEAFNMLSHADRRRQVDLDLASSRVGAGGTKDELLRAYMQRGVKAYREKNFIEAADNFDRATKADPGSPKAWHHLALACSQERRWIERALKAIARACELDPMKVSYLKMAGQLHAQGNLPVEAERYYKQALKWGGEDPDISTALAELRGGGKEAKRSLFSGLFGKG